MSTQSFASSKSGARTGLPIRLLILLAVVAAVGILAATVGPWSVKEVQLIEGDQLVGEVRTRSRTVADVLSAAGIVLGEADTVSPALSERIVHGGSVVITRGMKVGLFVDGEWRQIALQDGTVRDALVKADVRMGPLDRVVPVRETALYDGIEITVIRVTQEEVQETEVIPYATTRWAEPHLARGETRMVREGKEGLLTRTYQLTYENGELAHRKLIATEVVEPAVDEIIGVGTREAARVLQTPTGTYHYIDVIDMVATAYYPGPESTGEWADGYTYTGLLAGRGVVAVDPKVIPLGTRLYVPGYGEAIAADIGGAIKGNRIDLGFATYEEAIQYGRKSVKVYILGP